MPYYKAEYEANGHEIIVQKVRGPDSDSGASEPHLWINHDTVYLSTLQENPDLIPEEFYPNDFMDTDEIEKLAAYLASEERLICRKCNDTFPIENAVTTGFAGVKCGKCANRDSTCDDGGDHEWNCTNPHQKHNARMPTKYKCEKCGKKKQTTPTG